MSSVKGHKAYEGIEAFVGQIEAERMGTLKHREGKDRGGILLMNVDACRESVENSDPGSRMF